MRNYKKNPGFPFGKPPPKIGSPQLFGAFRKHSKKPCISFGFPGFQSEILVRKSAFQQWLGVSRKASYFASWFSSLEFQKSLFLKKYLPQTHGANLYALGRSQVSYTLSKEKMDAHIYIQHWEKKVEPKRLHPCFMERNSAPPVALFKGKKRLHPPKWHRFPKFFHFFSQWT